MSKENIKSVLLVMAILTISVVFAQNPSAPNRTPPPPPGVPIDGGIFALLSVALGYAINKLRIKK
ncbi:MAG TPA: hypothetical protein ENK67_06965 [Flavobacteriia bacterium]|nr:hypothetical protein [Flavobacteriia bacterium]